eukprot:1628009-Rhodomonas_salina.1
MAKAAVEEQGFRAQVELERTAMEMEKKVMDVEREAWKVESRAWEAKKAVLEEAAAGGVKMSADYEGRLKAL